jgi:hypothetical protein
MGPKRKKIVASIFTQIRPVWIGELGQKLKKINGWGLVGAILSAKAQSTYFTVNMYSVGESYVGKKVVSDCFYIQ